jgi:hypothetical protein
MNITARGMIRTEKSWGVQIESEYSYKNRSTPSKKEVFGPKPKYSDQNPVSITGLSQRFHTDWPGI